MHGRPRNRAESAYFQFLAKSHGFKVFLLHQCGRFIQLTYNKKLDELKSSKMNICFEIHHNDDASGLEEIQSNPSCIFQAISTQPSATSLKKAIRPKKRIVKQNQYNWNETENRRYITFLSKHGSLLMLSTEEKKRMRVNVLMSKAIQSRNSTQCHTHHQKMMEKHGTIEEIIAEFSYLLKHHKKTEKKITTPFEIQEAQENFIMAPLEEDFARSSFFREYLSPACLDKQKQEEFLDFIWQL